MALLIVRLPGENWGSFHTYGPCMPQSTLTIEFHMAYLARWLNAIIVFCHLVDHTTLWATHFSPKSSNITPQYLHKF
jgi:hypothetical protein